MLSIPMSTLRLDYRVSVAVLTVLAILFQVYISSSRLIPSRELALDANVTSVLQQLHGSWRLTSYEVVLHTPWTMRLYPLGKDASGLLLYTPDGFMSAQIMQPGCPPFTARTFHWGSKEEMARAAKHYLAYSGPYSVAMRVDGTAIINHEADVSLYPNWAGTHQPRVATLNGTELTLSPDGLPSLMGLKVEVILKWRKMGQEST